jgi:hypothetical protein
MARIVLIHGYAQGLTNGFRPIPEAGGMRAFTALLETGEAALFEWYNLYNHDWRQTFSYQENTSVYFDERKKARNPQTLRQLHEFLMEHEPEVIVCFSMGSYLLLNYIKRYSLPECVTNISFVQADVPIDFKITDHEVLGRLKGGHLVWQNFWCFWDPALSFSKYLHGKKRAGTGKVKNPLIKNRFFPLYRNVNLHLSSIYDPNLVSRILDAQVIPPPVLLSEK